MSYDPDLNAALLPMEKLPEAIRSHYTPIGYDLEPELKISINPPPLQLVCKTETVEDTEMAYIQKNFLAFAQSFHRNALGEESYLDASGTTERDYVLVNMGQDTGNMLGNWVIPRMDIQNNGYQYRERFALPVFSGLPLNEIGITKFDANAKTLLSRGTHRKEFETGSDSEMTSQNSFDSFRQVAHLPEFFQGINPDNLYVIKTWMTSRTSFVTLTRVPQTQLFALCEHCCDVTKYTTANFEQFINGGRKDAEWETEIKGFYGKDDRLSTLNGQIDLIEILFCDLYQRFRSINPNISTHSLSKMERAREHTSTFYEPTSVYKAVSGRNNPFAKQLDKVGICPGLAHAFTHAVRAKDVTKEDNLPKMISLAMHMPNPKDILDNAALKEHIHTGLIEYKAA